jgi:catechol 2,3-dioxygenase-like lactoylglutathione lyase family enzyme
MFWIDHVGVVASDLDASIAFYTKLFGPPIDRVEWRGEHAANVARLMGRPPGLELDAVFFRIPHTNAIFELVHFRGVDQATVVAGNVDIGATHFGFAVDDIEATVARLGLEVSGTPMDLPIGPYRGGRSVYLKDPDGANIQLMQLAGRPGRMPVLRPGDPPQAPDVRATGARA